MVCALDKLMFRDRAGKETRSEEDKLFAAKAVRADLCFSVQPWPGVEPDTAEKCQGGKN